MKIIEQLNKLPINKGEYLVLPNIDTPFFIIPMIVLEKKGVREGLRDGRSLFGKTWGENVTSGLGIGLITVIGIVISLGISFLIFMISPEAGIIVGVLLIGENALFASSFCM